MRRLVTKFTQLFAFALLLVALVRAAHSPQEIVTEVVADSKPYLYTSTHDLTFELSSAAVFNVCLSEAINETLIVLFTCDRDVVDVSRWSITFEPQEPLCQELVVHGKNPGQAVLRAYNTSTEDICFREAFVRLAISRHKYLDAISNVVGWVYFLAWTVNFFPQMRTNYQRKSVEGLNLDFLSLNVLGFFAYSVFNCGLFFIPAIQVQYLVKHPFGVIPVEVQDIAFAVFAFVCSSLTGLQAIIYDRGPQKVSKICLSLLASAFIFLLVSLALSFTLVISWLTYLYYFSYIKLGVTCIKYIPQAILNYRRKCTIGYNIVTVIMDVGGGTFSLLQMFIIAHNYDDWSSLSGNPTKLLLSCVSLVFDAIFLTQHYVLYRRRNINYQTLVTDLGSADGETDIN